MKRGDIMAKYYVDGKLVEIPIQKKAFGEGSEGKLYLLGGKLYKIYNPEALNDGLGNKRFYHQALLEVKDLFNTYVLPESLIFEEKGSYVGYMTEKVGEKKKQKEGITEETWPYFIENLEELEKETDLLSENRFLAIDMGFHNSIFSKENHKLYIVDPGRYHHQSYFTIGDYYRRNHLILNDYFFHMLEREIIYFKLMPYRKSTILVKKIEQEKGERSYSKYFEQVSQEYDSIHEFFKEKGKYLR